MGNILSMALTAHIGHANNEKVRGWKPFIKWLSRNYVFDLGDILYEFTRVLNPPQNLKFFDVFDPFSCSTMLQ